VVNEKTSGENPAWTHIPQVSCQELFSTYGVWSTAYDDTKTPVGIPPTRPEFSVVVKDIRRLALPFRDQGSASKARPYGMSGAVVRWGVQDAPPTEPEKLPNSKLATRTPYILNFTEEERGKTVYIVMCWQNEKGDMGSFSEIQSQVEWRLRWHT
jgi:hypothetical protein